GRLGPRRMALVDRCELGGLVERQAEHRFARGPDDVPDVVRHGRRKDVVGRDRIDPEGLGLRPEPRGGDGREVDDRIHARQGIEPARRTPDGRLALPARIAEPGVVAIARRLDPAVVASVAEALVRGGVGAFEITLDGGNALATIRALRDRFDETVLLVGAGTVIDAPSAEEAVRAGAGFLVTPSFDEGVVRTAVDLG